MQPIDLLPMQLSIAMAQWLSSNGVLQLAKPALHSSSLSSNLNDPAQWQAYLNVVEQPKLIEAIRAEAFARAQSLCFGVHQYQQQDYRHTPTAHAEVWSKAHVRLLDYSRNADSKAPALLFLPSLINKYYVLDLMKHHSMLRYMQSHGFAPYVIDWGEPAAHESNFATADYVQHYAVEALQHLYEHHEGPIIVVGYCMGGVLALGLAQLAEIDGLVLLATPWDFHAKDSPRIPMEDATVTALQQAIDAQPHVPATWLQTAFHLINPWHFHEKFREFPQLGEADKKRFLAIESWVNDGVPLTRAVGKECLIDWPHHNKLAQGAWQIDGETVDPATTDIPTLVFAPTKDKIVPKGCASPLARMINSSSLLTPECGHVSMVAGKDAQSLCWEPLAGWVHREFS